MKRDKSIENGPRNKAKKKKWLIEIKNTYFGENYFFIIYL
jgi:hypothetical protein